MSHDSVAFIFPGQGSQYLGMGSDIVEQFPAAAEIFNRANDVLSFDILKLCFADPNEQLGLTRYTQPALLTHEIACLEAFRSLLDTPMVPSLVGGHSLGEYAALVAAGSVSFEDALKLVARRGELMSDFGTGGMLATTLDQVTAIELADRYFCDVAGCNLPDQTVVAGTDEDLDALTADLQQNHSGKRAIRLATEGAFHSYLMVEAAREFRKVLDQIDFEQPNTWVLSNYTGKFHDTSNQGIRSRLFFQLFNPVRWYACLQCAFDVGIDTLIEFGGGIGKSPEPEKKRPNLEGIIKKSLKFTGHDAQYLPAINAASIQAAADSLNH